jgi:hypothetical protein
MPFHYTFYLMHVSTILAKLDVFLSFLNSFAVYVSLKKHL